MCPVIRSFLIRINDSPIWSDDLHRTNVLLPLIPRIVGTNNPELLSKRMFFLVNWSVKTIAPLILRWQYFEDHAETFESLKDIVDYESANVAYAAAIVAKSNFLASGGDSIAGSSTLDNVANATYCAFTYSANAVDTAAWAAVYAANAVITEPFADLKEKIVVEIVEVLDQLLDIR